ncbi:MAG TPA: rhomboid family protein [Candidatus Hydrogenedentes bacterium]|nr:rhomboid family protein [Candidatus Hydrogenedentota bacterium]HQH51169.1 rhomboid family protein [Candidatus Hydrogenedentota bacterium]
MVDLVHQRCFNHAVREAAAQCLECGRFFCRECITEHEGRILCAKCIEGLHVSQPQSRFFVTVPLQGLQLAAGIALTWLLAYGLGRALISIPSSFHDGTLLRSSWWENL